MKNIAGKIKETIADKVTGKVKETGANIFNLSQPNANITTWLKLGAKEYELKHFKINFAQASDYKGQPQHEIQGGKIMLTLSETVGTDIYNWAVRPNVRHNGEINFKTEGASNPMTIEFKNAFCLSFDRVIDTIGGGCETILVISPEEVWVNGIEHNNFW